MLNGLYDPLITGTGHQPRGFDQVCPVLYASYNVTGCKVLIEGRFESANLDTAPVTGQLYVGAQPSGTVVLPGSWSEALETKEFDVITRTDQQWVRFSKYYDIAKVVGVLVLRLLMRLIILVHLRLIRLPVLFYLSVL